MNSTTRIAQSTFLTTTALLLLIMLLNNIAFGMNECDTVQQKANQQLLEAAESGNFTEVQRLITENIAHINATNSNGSTPLILAAGERHNNIIHYLVKTGANVNVTNKWGITALALTACSYDTTNAEILLNAGAQTYTHHKDARSALMFASDYANTNLINLLIAAKADIPAAYKIRLLELAIDDSRYKNLPFQIINPMQKQRTKKNIETLLAIYNQQCPNISELPKDLIKIITTYAYPEYAIDAHIIASIDPAILVNTVPIEILARLIKNDTLHRDTILERWKNKLANTTQALTKSKKIDDNKIQAFADTTLKTIEALFT